MVLAVGHAANLRASRKVPGAIALAPSPSNDAKVL
jgi:hypothetical protein